MLDAYNISDEKPPTLRLIHLGIRDTQDLPSNFEALYLAYIVVEFAIYTICGTAKR